MIDGLALLLQSPDQSAAAAGGADGGWPLGEMIALGSLALLVGALLFPPTARRLRALLPAREASGRLPADAMVGVVGMAAFLLAGTIGATTAHLLGATDDEYGRLLRGVCGNLLQCLVVVLLVSSRLFRDGPRKGSSARIAIAAGALSFVAVLPLVGAVGIIAGAVAEQFGLPRPPEVSHETLRILLEKGDTLFTLATLAHVAVLVPVAEELGWRGVMQPTIRAAGAGPLVASALTAAIFAAIHWDAIPAGGRAVAMPMLVALGLALGLLREKTGGVLAPIALHALFNAWNVAVTLA
jgi:membrane protease YdiL (CAAX protease family)